MSDASQSGDEGDILSDEESEMDFPAAPKLPEFTSPKPGALSRLDELRLGGAGSRDFGGTNSPFKPSPSPSLAKIVAETPDAVNSPMIEMIRDRTAEDIVADIERQRSPVPPQDDVLSDADSEDEIDDADCLSDASNSESEIETTQPAKLRSEAMHAIIEEDTYISGVKRETYHEKVYVEKKSSRYTSEYALQLVEQQIEEGDYEEVKVGPGEGINIAVEFTGKPAPMATWVHDGGLPVEAVVTTTDESTTLKIDAAEAKHQGTYGLVLENEFGAQTAAFQVVLDVDKSSYYASQVKTQTEEYEATFSKPPPKAISAQYGQPLVLEAEVEGEIVTMDWELEGSAEYFESETVYKNGVTHSKLTIDQLTDETCGTYICTAMTSNATYVSRTEVTLARDEKSLTDIEAEVVKMGHGLKIDGSLAAYERTYEEGSFSEFSESYSESQSYSRNVQKLKKNIKIETSKKSGDELFEIVLEHQEASTKWQKGQIVSVKEKVSGDCWEVQVESRDGRSRHSGPIKPWRLCEYQSGTPAVANPAMIYKQLAWNEQEFKKSMNRVQIDDDEIRTLLEQVLTSRTSLYGALQGKHNNLNIARLI